MINTLVLLADFPHRPHDPDRRPGHFRELLFSPASLPTGSMRDHYRTVSGFGPFGDTGVDVQGEVQGWFRVPQPLSFYADGDSGLTEDGFPLSGATSRHAGRTTTTPAGWKRPRPTGSATTA